ncbi:replication factor C subunit 1-like protein, partial [Leptotrombidium deliense]
MVDKYAPKNSKDIVGQNRNVNEYKQWLLNWDKSWNNNQRKFCDIQTTNLKTKVENTKISKNKNQNRSSKKSIISKSNYQSQYYSSNSKTFSAVLFAGNCGIGKTATAHIVAKELGYNIIELNASDDRSEKRLLNFKFNLQEIVRIKNNAWCPSTKNILIIDEIDSNVAVSTLTKIIKNTKIPVVCICNDEYRRTNDIIAVLQKICSAEKICVSFKNLKSIVEESNNDVRKSINMLSFYSMRTTAGTVFKNSLQNYQNSQQQSQGKDLAKESKYSIFNACKEVLNKNISFEQKCNLFFVDTFLMPMM